MTLFQVTAVAVSYAGPPCCVGLVQRVAIGPRRHEVFVQELDSSPSYTQEAFYAIIDDQFTNVFTGYCATCGAPFLTTDPHNEDNNKLLHGFAAIGAPPRIQMADAPTPRGRWWRRRSSDDL